MFAEVVPMTNTTPHVEVFGDDASLVIPRSRAKRARVAFADGTSVEIDCRVWQAMALIRHALLGTEMHGRPSGLEVDADENGFSLVAYLPYLSYRRHRSARTWTVGSHDQLDAVQSGHYPSIPNYEQLAAFASYRSERRQSRSDYVDAMVGSGRVSHDVAHAHADNLRLR